MGNGSSLYRPRTIHVLVENSPKKIVLTRASTEADIHLMLTKAAGVDRSREVALKDGAGSLIGLSGTMPSNTPESAYTLIVDAESSSRSGINDRNSLHEMLSQVAQQMSKSFRIDEVKNEMTNKLAQLEKRLEQEELRSVEISKCRKDIGDIKEQIHYAQKRIIDYNRLRPSACCSCNTLVCSHFTQSAETIQLKRDVPSYPKYTLSQETIDYLKQPTFDIWHWEPNEMLSLLEHMYHELGLVQHFNINPITLKRWLLCVQENYRNNPFHNFRHCFCVTQMMYGMINLCKLWEKISREDLGILMTACVCHDLDHPGYNNTYQINARTELAIRYNDISPLENHHCAVAFKIFSNPETNIFSNVDNETTKRIRAEIRNLILATDMAQHKDVMEKFQIIGKKFNFKSQEHKRLMKMVLIKCCDISNEVRPTEVSDPWVDCLLEEYFQQSDREKEEGLPVAPFMDRDKVTKPTAQIGFIKFVLIPMFESIAKLFPELDGAMVQQLREARDRYEQMKAAEDEHKLHTNDSQNNETANNQVAKKSNSKGS